MHHLFQFWACSEINACENGLYYIIWSVVLLKYRNNT